MHTLATTSSYRTAALLVSVALSVGCSDPVELASAPPPKPDTLPMPQGSILDYPVDAPGPFNVGYRTYTTTYDAPGGVGAREITINVWYPTLDKQGDSPHYAGLFPDADVFEGAALAPPMDPAGYPVHAYSHGSAAFGGSSSDVVRYFASHGWVAVAPDHKGNLLSDQNAPVGLTMHYLRSLDITAALDSLESLPADDPLAGKCLTKNVLLSGHSFGTQTTWATAGATWDITEIKAKCGPPTNFPEPCTPEQIAVFEPGLRDPRVKAGLPMAGGTGTGPDWFLQSGFDAVKMPFMLMSGTDDPVGAENVFAFVTSIDFTWIEVEGGCHQLFALGGCSKISDDDGFPIVRTYAQAFANRHILGDMSAKVVGLLDGTDVLSPKVTFQHK